MLIINKQQLKMQKHSGKNTTRSTALTAIGRTLLVIACTYIISVLVASCARMGQPDGGWYDEVPPRVIGATPGERATNVNQQKLEIRFSEYIKVENATENIIFCPPQLEQPEIKTTGKAIEIELKDTLKPNTTYTIDFSNAISDNNEGNPMGNYTYVFSTGKQIDTLEVSGYVLDAETLEPVKGSLVGLYSNLEDSAFTSQPMLRVGRTDGDGKFRIRGIAPGKYRIYSLMDSDADYKLSQRGEMLGFSRDIIEPTCKPDIYQDTTWLDTLRIADIKQMPYTHFLPDDICIRAFTQKLTDRYLIKTERNEPERFSVYFSTPSDSLPKLRALNFNDSAAFAIETSEHIDTITYWLKDTMLVNQDTLRVEMTYSMTDSLGAMVEQTDTIDLLPKIPYEKRQKLKADKIEEWTKKAEKQRKKGRKPSEPHPDSLALKTEISIPSKMAPNQNIMLSFETPLQKLDTAAIHLYSKIDTLWYVAPMEIISEGLPPRTYIIRGEWRPGIEYSLEIDSAAFVDIYGKVSDPMTQGVKIASEEDFGSLFVNMRGIQNDSAQVIVEMLDKSGNAKAQSIAQDGTAEFYYIQAGEYYLRCIIDANRNGKWDTGDYNLGLQPEEVYYLPESVVCKEKWDITKEFNIHNNPLYKQKPRSLVKQKGEQKKKSIDRNLKRAQDLKIVYDREAVNSKF